MMNSTKIFALSLITAASFSTAAFATEAKAPLFELSNGVASQTVSYDAARNVRICVDKASMSRGLKIETGLGTSVVAPGNCYTFKSQEFRVSARGFQRDLKIVGRVANIDE